MATANFTIKAEDGWVEVTSAGTNFVKITSNVPKHPFFVTSAASAPAATAVGFKVEDDDGFCVNVANTDKYYVRVPGNTPNNTRIDVFYILT